MSTIKLSSGIEWLCELNTAKHMKIISLLLDGNSNKKHNLNHKIISLNIILVRYMNLVEKYSTIILFLFLMTDPYS